jgi:tetratricopeptide (TPR) repeat protein
VQNYPDSARAVLYEALVHSNEHIRYNAVQNYFVDSPEAEKRLLPLLKDGALAIRIEAAEKLYVLPKEQIPNNYKKVLKEVLAERFAALEYNADFPTGKFNLGNFYYNTGQMDKAEEFFSKALEQDNLLHSVKVNLAYVYNQQGKYEQADKLFLSYLEYVPQDGNVTFSYGLFLSERARYEESLEYMLKASELVPDNVRIFYNIAMMYEFYKDVAKNEMYLKLCIDKEPGNVSYYSALLNHYLKNNQQAQVKRTARVILELFPDLENRADIEVLLSRQ